MLHIKISGNVMCSVAAPASLMYTSQVVRVHGSMPLVLVCGTNETVDKAEMSGD